MKTKSIIRSILTFILIVLPVVSQAQTDKKAAELKKAEAAINTAKAKIALCDRQLDISDSLINAGTQMIMESKAETKLIGTDRKKLDKDYSSSQKTLAKLTTSKDKEEATKAKADLKALDIQYKLDSKVLDNRLKETVKKSTRGESNLSKGKTSGKTGMDALKSAQAALEAAQEKYDAATGNAESETPKGKKK